VDARVTSACALSADRFSSGEVLRALQRWPALLELELVEQEDFPVVAARMPSLHRLVLWNVGVGAQGAADLAAAPRLAPALRRLRFSERDDFEESYPAALQTLLQTPWL
jgi:hypothetical protein